MKIGILGTGMVGRIIALKLTALGHTVVMGTRNVEETMDRTETDAYGNAPFSDWIRDKEGIDLMSFDEAAQQGELLFNCTSGTNSLKVLRSVSPENLKDKVLIDIANPLDFSKGMPPTLNPVNDDSLGEQIQREFPGLKVVKTLNTMTATVMVNPSKISGEHNVFICGNDAGAKRQVSDILNSLGWKDSMIIDLGDITNARGTEMLLPIWLRLWNALGTADFNFHIQK